MKPAPFDYIRPETVDGALDALAEHGDDATILAGGLSLGAMMNLRLASPEVVIDINRIAALEAASLQDGWYKTGALVRQSDAMTSPEVANMVPLLSQALPNVGHYQTRSRGTLAGSVAHADPSAEIPLCLATLGGEVELTSARGTRRVDARNFAEAALYTIREPDEMVTALFWPADDGRGRGAFQEITQRHGDFAIVAAAAWVRPEAAGIRYALGFGGVEDRPRIIDGRTGAVDTQNMTAFAQDAAQSFAAELEPMQDPRAGADYRRSVAGHIGATVLQQALAELSEAAAG